MRRVVVKSLTAGLLVAAVAVGGFSGTAPAAGSIVTPRLDFQRVEDGMLGVLCARPDIDTLKVTVDGAVIFAFDNPPNAGGSCGSGGAGVYYPMLVEQSVISAHLGRKTVRVEIEGSDSLRQVTTAEVLFASGAIRAMVRPLVMENGYTVVAGWAVDPNTGGPARIEATVISVSGHGSKTFFNATRDSPAAAAANPGYGRAHGFRVARRGKARVCIAVTALDGTRRRDLGCQSPPDRPVQGYVEWVGVTGRRLDLSGWVYDPDGPTDVAIAFNGWFLAKVPASVRRPDVSSSHDTGWSYAIELNPGTYNTCVFYLDKAPGVIGGDTHECHQVVVK